MRETGSVSPKPGRFYARFNRSRLSASHPAQHDSCATSLKKVCAQSFKPSTIVR